MQLKPLTTHLTPKRLQVELQQKVFHFSTLWFYPFDSSIFQCLTVYAYGVCVQWSIYEKHISKAYRWLNQSLWAQNLCKIIKSSSITIPTCYVYKHCLRVSYWMIYIFFTASAMHTIFSNFLFLLKFWRFCLFRCISLMQIKILLCSWFQFIKRTSICLL